MNSQELCILPLCATIALWRLLRLGIWEYNDIIYVYFDAITVLYVFKLFS